MQATPDPNDILAGYLLNSIIDALLKTGVDPMHCRLSISADSKKFGFLHRIENIKNL
jgi:hypothetical protein